MRAGSACRGAPNLGLGAWVQELGAVVPRTSSAADRDQAWRDFAGWRVNYDTVLLAACDLTSAPEAPWSSDRAGDRSFSGRILGRAQGNGAG